MAKKDQKEGAPVVPLPGEQGQTPDPQSPTPNDPGIEDAGESPKEPEKVEDKIIEVPVTAAPEDKSILKTIDDVIKHFKDNGYAKPENYIGPVYATADGNIFYEQNAAYTHHRQAGVKLFIVNL